MAFPRVSLSGVILLLCFFKLMHTLFQGSIYGILLDPTNCTSTSTSTFTPTCTYTLTPIAKKSLNRTLLLHGLVSASSFLNVVSHGAVVLGALHDTYVLSILVGVGFDVLTRLLQLIAFLQLTLTIMSPSNKLWQEKDWQGIDSTTLLFLSTLFILYIYHMVIHVRALFLQTNATRLQTVLTSSLNNLRGQAGTLGQDHFFAYTDLGTHVLAMQLSSGILLRHKCIHLAVGMLFFLALLSYGILSNIPNFHWPSDSSSRRDEIQLFVAPDQSLLCNCHVCESYVQNCKEQFVEKDATRTEPTPHAAFKIHSQYGICQLWLLTFESLSLKLQKSIARNKTSKID